MDSSEEKAKQNAQDLLEKMQDLGEGKLPSNEDLVAGIKEIKQVPKNVEEQKGSQLSETGKEVLSDTTRVLDSVERLVKEKNQGDLFQQTFLHAKKAGELGGLKDLKGKLSGLVSQQEAQKAQEDAQQGAVSLVTLVRLLFTSSEFRQVLFEFGDVCLDILSEKSSLVAKFHEELEPKASTTLFQQPSSSITTEKFSATSRPFGETQQQQTQQPQVQLHKHVEQQQQHNKPTTTATKTTTKTTKKSTGVGESSHVSQQDEDKLLDKFLELLSTLKKKPEFRNSIRWLFMSLESLGCFLQEKQEALQDRFSSSLPIKKQKAEGSENIGGGGETPAERELQLTADNAKALVERWIDRPLKPLIDLTDQLSKKFQQDQQTRDLLHDIVDLVKKCCTQEGYLENNQEQVRNEFFEKRDSLKNLLSQKYEPICKQLSHELQHVLDNLKSDPAVQEFSDSCRHLMETIFLDKDGNPIFKSELIQDCQLILPDLLEKLQFVAIPKIEGSTADYDYCYEDIAMRTSQLYPENFSINLLANLSRDMSDEASKANFENIISIKMHDLHADLTNIRFWYEKKTGFPQFSDAGLLDISIYGSDGLSIELELEPTASSSKEKASDKQKDTQTKIRSCKCTIHKLDMHFHETKHDFLYAIFSPFIESYFKNKVESAIEESIKTLVYKIDESIQNLPNPKEFIQGAIPPSREVES